MPPGLHFPISTRSLRTYSVRKTISRSTVQHSASSVSCRTQPARLSPPKSANQNSAVPGAGPRGRVLTAGVGGEPGKRKGCELYPDA